MYVVNIRYIAKMANVSATTVSRVLNNHPYVSEDKKVAVLQAVEESNYQRNINAVHLSKGKTFLIGVVIPFSNHPYFGQLIEGIANQAVENNYNLVLFQTNYEEKKEKEALNMLRYKQIDALIICSRTCTWDKIKTYTQYGSIVLCEDAKGKNVSSTFVDHYKTFTTALDYLKEKGHSKIGYCVGRRSGINSKQRELAYRDFVSKNKQSFRNDYIFDNCLYFEDGETVIQNMRKMSEPPSALLVTSDQVAAGILVCCENQNISVPDDLAIIGFDNQPIAKIMGLTTIEMNLSKIGQSLFHQATSDKAISKEEIAAHLIQRDTV
jgi:DNA-binding LacI/PurR family transcriptional regulator